MDEAILISMFFNHFLLAKPAKRRQQMMTKRSAALRDEVHQLAEKAFDKNLISGYGDGEYADEYQLYIEGKPRHYSLEYARNFLEELLEQSHQISSPTLLSSKQ